MIKANIVGGCGRGYHADVVNGTGEAHALVVATRPLKVFENDIRFFTNDEHGANMNINAAVGGTAEEVHNGIDDVLWTATDIVGGGKTTFNSTEQHYEGARSIKVNNAPTGDIFQIAKGSDLDCTGYVSLTMWVYPDKDWKRNDVVDVYGWDTGTGTQVGDAVDLSDYFSYDDYDTWHKVTIPLTDMGDLAVSTTLDSLRFKQTAKEGKAPKYYLDTIQFEETGTPVPFVIAPDKGTWLHVESFAVSVADAMAGTLLNGTLPAYAYDKVLGVTMSAGLAYQRIQAEKVQFSQTIASLMDLMQMPGTVISGHGSDGTNTWLTAQIKHQQPLILKAEHSDKLQWTVSEDLTGLLHLRISAGCSVEVRDAR